MYSNLQLSGHLGLQQFYGRARETLFSICWFQHLYNVSRRPNSTNTKCNNGYENDSLQNPINDSIISSIPFDT